jgi:glutaredoxin
MTGLHTHATAEDGAVIQQILGRLTGRRTVPNILIQGNSIGGSDDVHALHASDKLVALFTENGVRVQGV